MPTKGYKLVTVKESQWNAIQRLVTKHPYIAGNSVAEFYRVAAQERLLTLINQLKLSGMDFLVSEEEREKIRKSRERRGLPPVD